MSRQSRKQLSKDIWSIVFGDSLDFTRLYFDKVYRDEDTHLLTLPSQGCALSHVQALNYRWKLGDTLFTAGYISGAATLPAYRGQGLVAHLMKAAHVAMYRRGNLLSFLIPANRDLFTFYQTFYGYTSSPASLAPLSCIQSDLSNYRPIEEAEEIEAYLRFSRWQCALSRVRMQMPLHGLAQWNVLYQDLLLARGGIYTSGSADYYLHPDGENAGLYVVRFVVPHSFSEETVAEYYTADVVPASVDATQQTLPLSSFQPLTQMSKAMLRIINVPQLLTHLPSLLPLSSFDLIDEQVGMNTGRYIRSSHGGWQFFPMPAHTLSQPFPLGKLNNLLVEQYPALVYLMLE